MHIVILSGGNSSEREISLSSGKAVSKALLSEGFKVTFLDPACSLFELVQQLQTLKPTAIFNALHGGDGENGVIQGLLDLSGTPYTHSGVLASSTCMDKKICRDILIANDLPVPPGRLLSQEELAEKAPFNSGYVIKPVADGSSVGVSIFQKDDAVKRKKIAAEWNYNSAILAEAFIPGLELTVGVLDKKALEVTEIRPQKEGDFYSFDAKYLPGGSQHLLPAPIPSDVREKAFEFALKAHSVLNCAGASRTDFRFDPETNTLAILEVNTQPGLTDTSLLPEQAKFAGISFPELCKWMITDCLNRFKSLPKNFQKQPIFN
ncbi:D-alanine--D-alanine ligase [Acetobacteraceae bacterium]|nr:D-alanine--D-alanine ligase [Acetobacteraceae bacterium]